MITSSSKRIIKRPVASQNPLIENYLPPAEQLLNNRVVLQKPLFPQYTAEGRKKEEQSFDKEPLQEEVPSETELRSGEEAAAAAPVSAEIRLEAGGEKLLDEWKEEGARLLEEARQEAARILNDSRAQAEEERRRAYEEGRREGYKAGFEEGRAQAETELQDEIRNQLADFHADMKQALQSVDTAKENCLKTYLDELKNCAIAVGEKVIYISLKSSGEVIKQMIISATEKLKKTAWVKIYIDKYDYDMMMEADAGVVDELSRLSDNIKFIVMDKEERGSCIVEMPEEIVDVSVNTQMSNIREILENIRL